MRISDWSSDVCSSDLAMRYNRLKALGALYWYTVEFGLIEEAPGDIRAYGAGILSGPTEAVYATGAKSPNRIMLNVDRVMRTDYVISDLQIGRASCRERGCQYV